MLISGKCPFCQMRRAELVHKHDHEHDCRLQSISLDPFDELDTRRSHYRHLRRRALAFRSKVSMFRDRYDPHSKLRLVTVMMPPHERWAPLMMRTEASFEALVTRCGGRYCRELVYPPKWP